jgi:hypothetical protein
LSVILGRDFCEEVPVKRFFFLICLCLTLLAALPAAAQEIADENKSPYFYVKVPIERVYPYRLGYVVEYRRGLVGRSRVYLPLEWFTGSAGKGEYIAMGTGSDWPYLTVYYKDKEFSHVRLYVRRDLRHETWGNLPMGLNLDDRFENVTDVKLEF